MAATDFVTEAQVDSLTTTIATAVKSNATAIGTVGDLDTTATDLTEAVNEVKVTADAAAGGGVAINDGVTNGTNAWSSSKIDTEISTAVSGLIDSAPGVLDTLDELAAALGDDANFATTMSTALGLRLRVDASQGLTGPQQAQGVANLGLAASGVDFAAAFTTAIA